MASSTVKSRKRCEKHHDQQGEPNGSDLCERLDVEAVGIAHASNIRGLVGEKVTLIGAGSCAEDGMASGVVPCQPPEVRATVAGEAQEPPVQIALRMGRRRLE